ncbi:hypothetical protein E7T06_12515 [Deinococcus sp. Arct2-2]|uniref:hypothetical protein n=1 Tax=Deinococcus sp. Arct2-2 TaxID=2568653 RepID=UPI0010A33E06|nr:hypothetical protein [Deinococcus sp. Arct2-2]THF69308.1 hypothetical protein E7T06_12515 [Deinococcus sp. Arct2-2]
MTSPPELSQALRDLLGDLHAVSQAHGELHDTECRERLLDAVYLSFLQPRAGYELPHVFGLYAPEGNAQVRQALARYVQRAGPAARQQQLSAQQRLDAFQNPQVLDPGGNSPDEYFGWLEELPDEAT